MADEPLPAPETPEDNRRRLERERVGIKKPKGTNRNAKHSQAKPSQEAKRAAWSGDPEDNRHG